MARLVVLAALAFARYLVGKLPITDAAVRAQVHQGLLAWDGGWYRKIAEHGYGPLGREALRFFPLFPLLGRFLGRVSGGHDNIALIVVANASALATGALMHRLVIMEGGDKALAQRAAWLIAVAPPAFVLVLGYSEALFMALAAGTFVALRRQQWLWAAVLGALAGLTRPLGMFLAVAAVIEVWHATNRNGAARRASRLGGALSIAGPIAGTGAYLWWSGMVYGDALLPLRTQQDPTRRGGFVDPFTAMWHEARGIAHGHQVGSALHVPWAIGLIVLLVVCARRWPASYTAFAALILAAALTSRNLDSLERYGLSAFPLVLAAAGLFRREAFERAVLTLAPAAMEGYATLAFLTALVP